MKAGIQFLRQGIRHRGGRKKNAVGNLTPPDNSTFNVTNISKFGKRRKMCKDREHLNQGNRCQIPFFALFPFFSQMLRSLNQLSWILLSALCSETVLCKTNLSADVLNSPINSSPPSQILPKSTRTPESTGTFPVNSSWLL